MRISRLFEVTGGLSAEIQHSRRPFNKTEVLDVYAYRVFIYLDFYTLEGPLLLSRRMDIPFGLLTRPSYRSW